MDCGALHHRALPVVLHRGAGDPGVVVGGEAGDVDPGGGGHEVTGRPRGEGEAGVEESDSLSP